MTATIHPPTAAGASCLAGRFVLLPDDPADGGPPDDGSSGGGTNTGVSTKTKPKTKKPPLYKVLLLNDDYTPMEFVVEVLEVFFNKDRQTATHIMLTVHTQGKGVCGIYTRDIAETKAAQVNQYARKNEHPLLAEIEESSD